MCEFYVRYNSTGHLFLLLFLRFFLLAFLSFGLLVAFGIQLVGAFTRLIILLLVLLRIHAHALAQLDLLLLNLRLCVYDMYVIGVYKQSSSFVQEILVAFRYHYPVQQHVQ